MIIVAASRSYNRFKNGINKVLLICVMTPHRNKHFENKLGTYVVTKGVKFCFYDNVRYAISVFINSLTSSGYKILRELRNVARK